MICLQLGTYCIIKYFSADFGIGSSFDFKLVRQQEFRYPILRAAKNLECLGYFTFLLLKSEYTKQLDAGKENRKRVEG
jgi:hypothetical protein